MKGLIFLVMQLTLILPVFATTPSTSGSFFREAYIEEASYKYGVPSNLIRAVISVESSWRPRVMSNMNKPRVKRAHGLMQLMPTTAFGKYENGRFLKGECSDLFRYGDYDGLFDERKNIYCGTRYLAKQIKSFGSVTVALRSYSQGPGLTRRAGGRAVKHETKFYPAKIFKKWSEYAAKK